MIAAPCRDLVPEDASPWICDRFRRFFVDRAQVADKPLFFHKFTGWPRARFVNAIFPTAKFVHVVRDGRAVANSLLQVSWWRGFRGPPEWSFGELRADYADEWLASNRSFAMLAALEWKTLMDAFEVAEKEIAAERWLNVRYEDFVQDSRGTLARILEFADIPWTSDFDRQLKTWAIQDRRKDAYRTDLPPEEVERIGQSLSAHLRRWGYVVEK
jgi:omega-hydroxy-beta-dihydromenaquinone-9 sulfotransferase